VIKYSVNSCNKILPTPDFTPFTPPFQKRRLEFRNIITTTCPSSSESLISCAVFFLHLRLRNGYDHRFCTLFMIFSNDAGGSSSVPFAKVPWQLCSRPQQRSSQNQCLERFIFVISFYKLLSFVNFSLHCSIEL